MAANWRQTLYKDFDPEGFVTNILWKGINNENGNYLWYVSDNDAGLNSWVVTQKIGPTIKVADSDTIDDGNSTEADEEFWYSYNGHRFWKLNSGNYLWYSSDEGGWVITPKLGVGTEEVWLDDHDHLSPIQTASDSANSGHNHGDTDFHVNNKQEGNVAEIDHCEVTVTQMTWTPDPSPGGSPDPYEEPGTWTVDWTTTSAYDGSSFTVKLYNYHYAGHAWWGPSGNLEGTYQPRGSNRGYASGEYLGTPKTVGLTYKGYKRIGGGEAPAGKYEEFTRKLDKSIDVPSGPDTAEIGLPQWNDNEGNKYIRSLETSTKGEYSYGKIYYDGKEWVIGIRRSRNGWWEGKEPDRNNTITFVAKRLDDDGNIENDPNTGDITISYDKLVVGSKFVNTFTDKIVLVAQVGMWL